MTTFSAAFTAALATFLLLNGPQPTPAPSIAPCAVSSGNCGGFEWGPWAVIALTFLLGMVVGIAAGVWVAW